MPTSSTFKPSAKRRKIALLSAMFLFILSAHHAVQASVSEESGTRKVRVVVNEQYLDEIVNLIKSARRNVNICHFSWNPDTTTRRIKNAVYEAVERGVRVRVILEGSLKQNEYAVKEFEQLGVGVKISKREWYLHAKLVTADGEKALLGSTNLSYKSINENNEANVLVESREITGLYDRFFDAVWRDTTKEINLKPQDAPYATAAVNRTYHPIMKDYVSSASKEISMIFYGMRVYTGGHNEVMEFVDELEDAVKNGVRVRVLLEKSSYDERLNEGNREALEYLASKGIEARFDAPEKITHAKLIIVDDVAAGVGSANFALSGFRFYQEANIVVKEKQAVGELRNYFERLWKDARPVAPKRRPAPSRKK